MVLWIAFAVLTAIVVAILTRSLTSGTGGQILAREADLAVYRDQLAEIDADRDRGLIEEAEATSARAELARRLIRRAEVADEAIETAGGSSQAGTRRQAWAIGLAVLVPVLTIGIYLSVGAPTLPGQPLSARLAKPPAEASVADLIGRVEAQLRAQPEDGRGWEVIAPIYLRMDRFAEAAHAFGQSLRLNGESVARLTGFGEATIMAESGIVTEPARKAFERALALDPQQVEARFWLALAKEQDGKRVEAQAAYAALLKDSPADAPWREMVEERMVALGQAPGSAPSAATAKPQPEGSPPTAPGPTAQDIAAAGSMSADERAAMIASMVDRLAERLTQNPADIEGWMRLVRAYAVLGRIEDAKGALGKARQTFSGDAGKLAQLDALASELKLGS